MTNPESRPVAEKESPFACDMTAIAEDRRAEHIEKLSTLFRAVEEMRELENGYSFRFTNAPNILVTSAEFIALERLCCPFFGFLLEVKCEAGEVWFTLNGRDGVKPFILAEIGSHLPTRIQS